MTRKLPLRGVASTLAGLRHQPELWFLEPTVVEPGRERTAGRRGHSARPLLDTLDACRPREGSGFLDKAACGSLSQASQLCSQKAWVGGAALRAGGQPGLLWSLTPGTPEATGGSPWRQQATLPGREAEARQQVPTGGQCGKGDSTFASVLRNRRKKPL